MIGSLAALVVFSGLAQAQEPTIAGVTVWVWDIGKSYSKRPTVGQSQVPNAYYVAPKISLVDPIPSSYGPLADHFAGQVRGWLRIEQPGTYAFQLYADDGGRLQLDGKSICDTEDALQTTAKFTAVGTANLKAGLRPLLIDFYEDGGKFKCELLWKPPGKAAFEPIPTEVLRTEPGQTFVTSPGVKTSFVGKPPTAPGDTRPLEAVHPSFTLENFRGPNYKPPVGAMCFLPDGRLALAEWSPDGTVDLLSNLDGPGPVKVQRYAEGLGEPLGMAWVDGHLLVTQKGEVTRLVDEDGDGTVDRFEVVARGWPMSQNYHEFTFNLLQRDGMLYVTISVPLRGGWTNYMPSSDGGFPLNGGAGSWIMINPKTGEWKRAARGFRTPNGMGVGVDGHVYVADNQGSWLPSSTLNILEPGAFYGHQETPDGKQPSKPPVVWFPQDEIGNSPSQSVIVPDGAYRGQMLIGDVTHGGLKRVFVEKVGGIYQGTVFRHSQGIEAGVNRVVWGPDGCLYLGGVGSNGNWNHLNHKFGLQRLRPNGKVPFEMLSIRNRKGGLLVEFTKPLQAGAIPKLKGVVVRQWRYVREETYGGPKIDLETLPISSVNVSSDHKQAFFAIPGMKPSHVVYFNMRGITGEGGESMWSPEAWVTVNHLSTEPATPFPLQRQPLFAQRPAAAEMLFDGTNLDKWKRIADGKAPDWKIARSTLEVPQGRGTTGADDIVTKQPHGDVMVHLEWLSPGGGNLADLTNGHSGVKFQTRYEVQILNTPGIADSPPQKPRFDEAGAILRKTAPATNPSYGAGVWQTYDIWFQAPKWAAGKKIANARMTVYWNGILVHRDVEVKGATGASENEDRGNHPLLLRAVPTTADGNVRFRNIWWVKDPMTKGVLPPWMKRPTNQ